MPKSRTPDGMVAGSTKSLEARLVGLPVEHRARAHRTVPALVKGACFRSQLVVPVPYANAGLLAACSRCVGNVGCGGRFCGQRCGRRQGGGRASGRSSFSSLIGGAVRRCWISAPLLAEDSTGFFIVFFYDYSHATYLDHSEVTVQSVSCPLSVSGGPFQVPLCPPIRPVPRRCVSHQEKLQTKGKGA